MDAKIVFTKGAWTIVRSMSYGFRANNLSASWEVHFDGKFYASVPRLKDGKKMIEANIKSSAPA